MQEYNISLSLDKETYNLLNGFAKTHGVNKSLIVRLLIKFTENNRYFLNRFEFYLDKWKNKDLTKIMIEEITKWIKSKKIG